MSAQRGPLWWAAHHRNHHRYADTTKDPHSSQHGFWYSHIGWFLNQKNFVIRQEMVKDWLKYPELIWLDRFSLPIVLMTAASIFCFGEALAHYAPHATTAHQWSATVDLGLLCIHHFRHSCNFMY